MNIKILDSWLRDYVTTKAAPAQIAEKLSLSSVSVERLEKHGNDYLYDIEVTTNRPDLMSLVGLARETAVVLTQNGISATFTPPELTQPKSIHQSAEITIKNDPELVNRILAVVMEVKLGTSPGYVKERLETTGIRSLNNLIDITNYVMRVIGHPTHVFDYDRLTTKKLIIRESKPGEKITTLDNKEYSLPGGDIIADDGTGKIVDLLGVMGTENSVTTDDTKRILFFLDNNDPVRIRKTSMTLGIRTEAAQINEKTLDPELAYDALLFGIKLYEELAGGKIISPIIDIYPNKTKVKPITVTEKQIKTVIGYPIPLKKSEEILSGLGFESTTKDDSITVIPPSFRFQDVQIPEDIIEEIARVYGYHNLPSLLPPENSEEPYDLEKNEFYWTDRVKDAMKYWGFTEVYTYSMVSEDLYEGPVEEAITLQNPLSEDYTYMRRTLVPSLLKVVRENKNYEHIKIFEITNVYQNKQNDLPEQILKFAGVIKKPKTSFYEVKGIIEQICTDLGMQTIIFKPLEKGGSIGSEISIDKEYAGEIEVLDDRTINFELNFEALLKHATLNKKYTPASKYPPIVEDLAIIAPENILTGDLIETIKKQNSLITSVSLLDKYQDTRTFHIIYQSYQKNLTSEEVGEIREKILKVLKEKFNAKLKE